MNQKESLREHLLYGAKTGHLLKAVRENLSAERDKRDDLAHELISLHNEGVVDVVAAFATLTNPVNGPDFFLIRHVFEKVLPDLSAPVESVLHCVIRLYQEAGQDMAAGAILTAYGTYCLKDPARPRDALKLIEANPSALADMLAATVAAGSQLDNPYYVSELLRLFSNPDVEFRRRIYFSVARIQWQKKDQVPDALVTALEKSIIAETDDHIFGAITKSAFLLFIQDPSLEERVFVLIREIFSRGGDFTLHAASELLWLNTDDLPEKFLKLVLQHLILVNPKNIGTLNNIDYGVAHLLKLDVRDHGLHFLEQFLTSNNGSINFDILDSAAREIACNDELTSKVLTRWFLLGTRTLCEAVSDLINIRRDRDVGIEVDATELLPADQFRIIFLARKAIGYLFIRPATAASLIISLMRHAPDDETIQSLGELLFDPLLLNYTGEARDYVNGQIEHESDKVRKALENSLTSIDEYLEVLRSVPKLPALQVGQAHRDSYRRHMAETMAESMKVAEKKSSLFNLFSRSTLLYGNKSINYIYSGDGAPHRAEMPLMSHGVSMEMPRMENIDPYGLNYMLRVFRVERIRT